MSVAEFLDSRPYVADPFQREAAEALGQGHGVLVTAPTGSGKTLVAEAAVHLARQNGRRVFYTTPIKALSNQKLADFVAEYGQSEVGLLTGDNVINPRAGIVVMTTEVLRNMIYADATVLDDVEFVILDEVHYLQDRFRGAVWEEVIIHAPRHVKLVCLSATVSNGQEFVDWLRERRGEVAWVSSDLRPVPLERMHLVADRLSEPNLRLFPLFTSKEGREMANRRLSSMLAKGRSRYRTPARVETIGFLHGLEMLPAIYFIFSRAGCEAAARNLIESGITLTDVEQRQRIRAFVEEKTEHLSDGDLSVLGYSLWVAGLEAGVAAHHAGLVPAFKETVEQLFRMGLIKVVFATETLALGINMPARTVVLDALSKYDGEGHSLLGPGDYTQLTGRAGRRGIDDIGYGLTLHSRFLPVDQVIQIASAGSHPLTSSFRPTANMAANLIANYEQGRAEELIRASFAQFQRRGSHDEAQGHVAELEARLPDEWARAECDLGSVAEYVRLIDTSAKTPADGLAGRLHPGDVIDIPGGGRAGRFVVLRRLNRSKTGFRFLVMGTSGRIFNISAGEIVKGSSKATTFELPASFKANDRKFQTTLTRRLRSLPAAPYRAVQTEESAVIDHPVSRCPHAQSHVKWQRRAMRTEKRLEGLRSTLRQSGVGLVEEFHAIQDLLEEWGYVEDWKLTPRGERLRFLYNESDLLLTEVAERGILWNLLPEELAAVCSVFVFEPRTDEPSVPIWPNTAIEDAFAAIETVWFELTKSERSHRLPATRRPDPGFVAVAHGWARGRELEDLLDLSMAPGDFVRVSRQLVDLVRQLREVMPELADDSRKALEMIDRGVVAAQGVG